MSDHKMVRVLVTVTREKTIEESGDLELEVPQEVIEDDELEEWVKNNVTHTQLDAVVEITTDDVEITSAELVEELED